MFSISMDIFLSLRRDSFFKRGGFSTATSDLDSYRPATTVRRETKKSQAQKSGGLYSLILELKALMDHPEDQVAFERAARCFHLNRTSGPACWYGGLDL